jgi:hypothetical protein
MDTLRISDTDREAAMDLLSEQYSVGRLTKDEFDERSDAVWSARSAPRRPRSPVDDRRARVAGGRCPSRSH